MAKPEVIKMIEQAGVFSLYKSGEDSNGLYTVNDYKRADDTLFVKSVLSGGTSPTYTTRIETYYGDDGATIVDIKNYLISYDSEGTVLSEVLV